MKARLVLVIVWSLLTACASSAIRVTYNSEPRGALITAVNSITPIGRAPVTRAYNLNALPPPDANGCVIIPGVEAIWDSGATARAGRLRICDLEDRNRYIELPRPQGYPNLEVDLEAAARQGLQQARDRDFRRTGGVEAPRSNPTGN
jgi:hypothetical protein